MLDFIRNPDKSASLEGDWTLDATGNWVRETSNGDAVHEGFQYDPYGTQSPVDESHVDDGSAAEGYNQLMGFQGGMTDGLTGLVHFEARDYDSEIGRWLEPDPTPLAYVDGPNLFKFSGDE